MGGAHAGEFASRVTVDKILHLMPRSFRQEVTGIEAGFIEVLEELFCRDRLRPEVPRRQLPGGMPRHGRHPEPLLAHSGMALLCAISATAASITSKGPPARCGRSATTIPTWAGCGATEKSREREARHHPAGPPCKRRWARITSSSSRKSARFTSSRATCSCSAPTG